MAGNRATAKPAVLPLAPGTGSGPGARGRAMAAKFIIVNNGLKDLRGHYFETSVSVAEAALQCGYAPILAAHVDCPASIIPPWLEFYPLFCTDHWMSGPAAPAPDLRGIRGDAAALARVPIDALSDGTAALGDYLRARFEAIPFPEPPSPAAPEPVPPAPEPPPSRPHWKAVVKRLLRGAVPPVFVPGLRRLWRGRGAPVRFTRRILRAGLPPVAYAGARALYRAVRPRPGAAVPVEAAPVAAPVPPVSPPPAPHPLAELFAQVGTPAEFPHLCVFQRDLERLLCLTGATCDDHVFLPTAHGRELIAVQQLVRSLPPAATPTFHLEFRHALDIGTDPEHPEFVHPYILLHRVSFDWVRREPPSPRIRLYTDTPELSEAYAAFSGQDFGVLPIPFRTSFVTARQREPKPPLRIAFFGDVREEKRFHWLPDLIEALMEDYVLPGKVRFLVQGTLVQPEWNPLSQQALARLKEMPPEYVQLVGLSGPIPPAEYYKLVSNADLVLCAYDPLAYSRRSSGTLTEGIAAGIPTVVAEGTWLERQQPPGTGETCTDLPSFIAAVRRICDDYPRYLKPARAAKERWLAAHTPRNLVKALVCPAGGAPRAGAGGTRAA